MIISLCAKGLTTGEVQAHLAETYGTDVSRETISKITDEVLEDMSEWLNRPFDRVYPVVFIDAIVVKSPRRPSHEHAVLRSHRRDDRWQARHPWDLGRGRW